MAKNYGALAKQAENATKGIKDRELRKEAFRILLLQLMAGGGTVTGTTRKKRSTRKKRTTRKKRRPGRPAARKKTKKKAARKKAVKKARKRPGRRGGGVVTTALNRLIAGNYFRSAKDAATIFRELRKRRVDIEPSQLRMELLRFTRARKLRRKIKMKGKKVTYLYSKR
jgi:hypothetical protein